MTSPKKVAANRRNALKSTGPKTPEGKARASRNNLRHGVLVAVPVIREMERTEEWDAHLEGVRTSLAPVGYLEEVLVDRAALLLWRMGRVARFERDSITAGVETAEKALAEETKFSTSRVDPYVLKLQAERASRAVRVFERLEAAQADEPVDLEDADAVLHYLDEDSASALEDEEGNYAVVSIPGVPDDEDERADFDAWTVGLLQGAVAAYGKATGRTPEGTFFAVSGRAHVERRKATAGLEDHRDTLARKKAGRLLLDEKVMDRVLRYETTMERAFLRTLHELQRLQAVRAGGSVPPPLALDVNVSGASGAGLEG